MACLFGHKWSGCKCVKCGQTRDAEHNWATVTGKCEQRCTVCEKTRELPHQYTAVPKQDAERCAVCGAERIVPHRLENGVCVHCGATQAALAESLRAWLAEKQSERLGAYDLLQAAVTAFAGIRESKQLEPACAAYGESIRPVMDDLLRYLPKAGTLWCHTGCMDASMHILMYAYLQKMDAETFPNLSFSSDYPGGMGWGEHFTFEKRIKGEATPPARLGFFPSSKTWFMQHFIPAAYACYFSKPDKDRLMRELARNLRETAWAHVRKSMDEA
ncbi:MAG: hypothetical protein GX418_09225 [Clostridiales bacterium]|nr:hypothetical protein [Clostridiales bacterium]